MPYGDVPLNYVQYMYKGECLTIECFDTAISKKYHTYMYVCMCMYMYIHACTCNTISQEDHVNDSPERAARRSSVDRNGTMICRTTMRGVERSLINNNL